MNRNCLEFNNFEEQNVRRAGVCLSVSTAVAMFVPENSDVYGTARGAAARAFCLFFNNLFDRQNSVFVENHHQNRRAVTQVNGQLKQEDITFVSYLDILKERRKQRVKGFAEEEYEWTEEPLRKEDLDEADLACVCHHLGAQSIQKQLNRFTCAECRPAYFYTRQADGNISISVDLLRPSRITYLKDSGNLFYGTEELYEHFINLECIFRQYVNKSIQFKNPRKELLKILELPAYNVAEETSIV
ncbi:hypothetical protein RvY_17133 [Ramazzottius varieornatus]|uniref:Uncharacterized protein n=1 Tax=Ramazzottius varieornatus TaxID=947166 RepID=A0A1D1W123_RAMVA|nr:hypothetical protein RvY_17133 [Ramazzottius varieornatus]